MVPQNHLLRKIDQFLNFDDLRTYLKPFYSHTGDAGNIEGFTAIITLQIITLQSGISLQVTMRPHLSLSQG